MAIPLKGNALLSRLKALLTMQRFNHTYSEVGVGAQVIADIRSDSMVKPGEIDMSKWRKMDSRVLGITRSMISPPSWIVLKILQGAGFEAYLVGGCVRDLLLNRIPKDFDVITTAALKQIKAEFRRCEIVGRRFPICRVHIKGSVIEVSSFETGADHDKEKDKFLFSQMPHGCDRKDFIRWRDCMRRDFTINSLFFDPFANKIYDYANAMVDLKSLKLQTLIPAQLSFEEDCARILRGMRIAARLGLSFSKETEIAIHKLSLSIGSLAKSRIMLELDYMLSYGAAERSLCLLWRFNLLEILLPFQAAYFAQNACKQASPSALMLTRLFLNMDKLVTCDRPTNHILWVGLLAFHMALVNSPQDALVVWTFASLLYNGSWKEGVKFAREHAQAPTSFIPEISGAHNFMSDDELAERVAKLASAVLDSIGALTETDSLLQLMSRFPDISCSGWVFISRKTGRDTSNLFSMLVHDVESYKKQRSSFDIDYDLLGKGVFRETRFVFGRIVVDTLSGGVLEGSKDVEEEIQQLHSFDRKYKVEFVGESCKLATSDVHTLHILGKEDKKRNLSPHNAEPPKERVKKQKLIGEKCNFREEEKNKKQKAVVNADKKKTAKQKQEKIEQNNHLKVAKKRHKVVKKEPQDEMTRERQTMGQLSLEKIITAAVNAVENKTCQDASCEEVNNSPLSSIVKCHLRENRIKEQEGVSEKERDFDEGRQNTKKSEKHKQDLTKKEPNRSTLFSLFR